jgi:hypothetical protein
VEEGFIQGVLGKRAADILGSAILRKKGVCQGTYNE